MTPTDDQLKAVIHLLEVARSPTDQGKIVADFLLAWHNPADNGGFDPTSLWRVDQTIARNMSEVFSLIADHHSYPDELGFGQEMKMLWKQWRQKQPSQSSSRGPSPA